MVRPPPPIEASSSVIEAEIRNGDRVLGGRVGDDRAVLENQRTAADDHGRFVGHSNIIERRAIVRSDRAGLDVEFALAADCQSAANVVRGRAVDGGAVVQRQGRVDRVGIDLNGAARAHCYSDAVKRRRTLFNIDFGRGRRRRRRSDRQRAAGDRCVFQGQDRARRRGCADLDEVIVGDVEVCERRPAGLDVDRAIAVDQQLVGVAAVAADRRAASENERRRRRINVHLDDAVVGHCDVVERRRQSAVRCLDIDFAVNVDVWIGARIDGHVDGQRAVVDGRSEEFHQAAVRRPNRATAIVVDAVKIELAVIGVAVA